MRKKGIKYLRRLVEVYVIFTKWKGVLVIENGKVVYVVWQYPRLKKDGNREYVAFDYTIRTFPKEELPKRIRVYQDKIRYEFKNRHNEQKT